MSELEDDLLALQSYEIEPDDSGGDLNIFKRIDSDRKNKKRKKNKLFKEIDGILDEPYSGDEDMEFAASLKSKKKDKVKADGDLFDTDKNGVKKFKNVEAKFKPEIANLQRILKDNEDTAKAIKEVLKPLITSKSRGSSKLLADLLAALNSANNNRLSVIKEMSSVKKAIYDLKLKIERESKDDGDLGMPADQFGSKMFEELFRMGRGNVIDNANKYNQNVDDFVTPTTDESSESYDDIINSRLSTEVNEYRSEDGTKMIEYESRQPEMCIEKSFSTGDVRAVAIDNSGVMIDDYPVPTVEQLGKLTFNNETHTCTDITGRVYKVIEVA